MASRAAHFASKRSSSWASLAAGAVSWLPSGGQLLPLPPFPPLLEVPFGRSIMMLLCGGTPLENGVENPASVPTLGPPPVEPMAPPPAPDDPVAVQKTLATICDGVMPTTGTLALG